MWGRGLILVGGGGTGVSMVELPNSHVVFSVPKGEVKNRTDGSEDHCDICVLKNMNSSEMGSAQIFEFPFTP